MSEEKTESDFIDLLIQSIKSSKKHEFLDDNLIKEFFNEFKKKYPKKTKKIIIEGHIKSKGFKDLLKDIKSEIRRVYSSYQTKITHKRKEILKDDTLTQEKKIIQLLESHLSTKERYSDFKTIFEKIDGIDKGNKYICDLSCGLNPLFWKLYNPKIKKGIFCTELNQNDCNFLKNSFKELKIKGDAIKFDLVKDKDKINLLNKRINELNIKTILILKTFDLIKHKISEEYINKLNYKNLIISFSKRTISNKAMNYPRRGWIYQLTKRLGLKLDKFETKNEIFYIIQR